MTHGLQHARLPCPPLCPGICSSSCPLSQWCYLTFSSSAALFLLPSIFFSITVFSNELSLHVGWPKYWRFSFSISPSIEYSGLISFSIDWFDTRSNQSILKEISPEYSLEGLRLRLKLQYFGHLMQRADSLGKNPDAGKD